MKTVSSKQVLCPWAGSYLTKLHLRMGILRLIQMVRCVLNPGSACVSVVSEIKSLVM